MKKILALTLAITLLLCALPLVSVSAKSTVGTSYYVDSVGGNDTNSGISEAQAWKSLEKVNNTTFMPGDKILFKSGGSWTGQLMPQGSGQEGAPICIDKYGGEKLPLINGNTSITEGGLCGATIVLYNQEYWEIRNLEITNIIKGDATVTGEAVWVIAKDFGQADHFVIENCNIHNLTNTVRAANNGIYQTTSTYTDEMGYTLSRGAVSFKSCAGGELIPTWFNDVTVVNNEIYDLNGLVAITVGSDWVNDQVPGFIDYTAEPFYSTNIYIAGNTIYECKAAITLAACDGSKGNGVVIEHNVSYNNNDGGSFWVFWHSYTIDVVWQFNEIYGLTAANNGDCGLFDSDGNTTGTIFQYNYTHGNRGALLAFCDVNWEDSWNYHYVDSCVFRYNISENDQWGSKNDLTNVTGGGRFTSGGSNGYIYNNVIYSDGYDSALIGFKMDRDTYHYIYNNIFYVKNGTYYYRDNPIFESEEYQGQIYVENNLFYGAEAPTGKQYVVKNNIIGKDPLFAGDFKSGDTSVKDEGGNFLYNNSGLGGIGLDTVAGYMLASGSPCIGAGKVIEDNGGRDYWGNPVSESVAPDIGAHQTTVADASRATASNLTVTKKGSEEVTLSWDKATDKGAVSRYVIYVDGKPHKTLLPTPAAGSLPTTCVVDGLSPDTAYDIVVRTYYHDNASWLDNGYLDSAPITVTTDALTAANTLMHIENITTYAHDADAGEAVIYPADKFASGDVITYKALVVDGSGDPVRNARVELQYIAEGYEQLKYSTVHSDNNGLIEFGTRAGYFPKATFTQTVNILNIIKAGYTYDKNNSANILSCSVIVTGYDEKYDKNIVTNGGFEELTTPNRPTDWTIINTNRVEAVTVFKDLGHDDGSNVLDIRASAAAIPTVQRYFSDLPNGSYTLTLWVRNNNSAANIEIANTGDSTKILSIPIDEEWNQLCIRDIKVSSGQMRIRISSTLSGDLAVYTQIDDVCLTRNMLYNTEFKEIYPIEKLNGKPVKLPSNYYYYSADRENPDIVYNTTDFSCYAANTSLQALGVRDYGGENAANVVRVQSDTAFKVGMGQRRTGLSTGSTYTFSAYTKSTGNISGQLRVYNGAGALLGATAIPSSEQFEVIKMSGITTTDGEIYAELYFEGAGSEDDYIDFYKPDLSCREDILGSEKMLVIPGQNLLASYNFDFEADGAETDGAPSAWTYNTDQGNGNAHASAEEAYTGKFSMKITLDEEGFWNPNPGYYSAMSVSPVSTFTNLPAGTYTLTWYEKSNFRYKTAVTTDKGYEAWSVADGAWNKITISNIKVTDGSLRISSWCDKSSVSNPPDEMWWSYVDNYCLSMNASLLDNGDMEFSSNNMPSSWQLSESVKYAKAISSKDSYNQSNYSLKLSLPGSDSTTKVSYTGNTEISGNYNFSAMIKGNAKIRFAIKPMGADTVYTDYITATDTWQAVELSGIELTNGLDALWIEAENQDDWTSGYVCVDDICIADIVSINSIAQTLPSFKAVLQTENKVTLPEAVIAGYTVELVSSSNTEVIANDGTVTTPRNDTTVALTVRITNNQDSTDTIDVVKLVSVYGINS